MKHIRPFLAFGLGTPLAALLGLASTPVIGEEIPLEKVEQAIKYRQSVMSTMGGLMGTAVGQLRDGFTFGPDLGAVATGLQAVTADIPGLFPEGTDSGDTEAKTEIWSDSAGFADKAKKATEAAAAFAKAVESDDNKVMMQAFKALGDSCKGCHETYREEEE